LAAAGLLAHFGLQAIINIGVNLRLLPATGMTLPFISYGGSSLCALALGMGMFLALTRRRPGADSPIRRLPEPEILSRRRPGVEVLSRRRPGVEVMP
jgi:Cell cycle protein